ncbi:MAG: selenium-dependent xanthine dehydrogenase [Megasphaera massiliensis]|uniref:selenium-dependent xanthine dehydrogenase n=1 Tax=Megasphaera massiliensis TaxID=1232428 RepID=UPI00210AAB92|nr:selenium-dependent xanthine dehydrogenase [Megasphaera massiliensis]MCQ5210835.1 selenium-dependent xanthine dehydrogenase [Megasphaera massiliensis]MEE0657606.1 selenium-dependent xanthine dehydrogenase [Megasphaera massiliensis]
MDRICKLWINGQEVAVDPERKLIDILRRDLRLKSVKDGCSEGACGTCTVIIDGKATKACVQKAGRLEGKHIVTVEGLSPREKDVFVYAFGEVGAVQCGFCIPGMVMCGKALIDVNPTPTRLEITAAIRNNICRCTGYKKIIDGIALAAEILRNDTPIPVVGGYRGVGDHCQRINVRTKVLGTGKYTDDLDDVDLPGMCYGSAIRSAYPRAIVKAIHTEKAKALPGVVCVLTAEDIPGSVKVGHLKVDWDTLIPVGTTTHYLGDAIVMVAAETPEILAEAKKLVDIEYEELPPLTCAAEALAEGAPLVHPSAGTNILAHEHLVRGDADAVIAASKYKVTHHFETPWTEHAFLEPECAVAMPFDDGVFIYSSDQGIYDTRRETALMLGLPEEKVVVENCFVGGGFGGKEDVTVQHLAALVAYVSKRICKVKLTRQESILIHPKRHQFSMDLTTACDENGKLTAMKLVAVTDNGAYASLGGPVLQRACTHAAGPYNYQTIDIEGTAVYTNNPPAGAFRGFGVTQTIFATELNLNKLAEMAGIDPWEIRYRNAIRPGEVLPNGQIADPATGLVETLEAVKDVYYQSGPYVGIACALKNSGVGVGLPDYGRCRLAVSDGRVHVYSSASCIGQGVGTVLVQIVSEAAGLPIEAIKWHMPNTATSPDAGTTSGSRQTTLTGEAARRAAKDLRRDLFRVNGLTYEGTSRPSDYLEGVTVEQESPTTAQVRFTGGDLEALNGREYIGEYLGKTDKMGADVANPVSHVAYGYATHVCILNEDGTIRKMVAAHDVGRVVNRKSLEGQIEGGTIMGCGYALSEQYPLDHCKPTAKYGTLGLMRADKAPDVEAIAIEKEGVDVAYGAIGVGEITSIPTAPAVAGAYYRWNGKFQTAIPLEGTPYSRKK